MAEAKHTLPDVLPGHWDTPDGAAMAREYVDRPRDRLMCRHLTDMQVAFGTAMIDRYALNHGAQLLVAKDRIRWLSVQLAIANADKAIMWEALDDIASSPCSIVNDSESIRASFNRLGRVARAALVKATGAA